MGYRFFLLSYWFPLIFSLAFRKVWCDPQSTSATLNTSDLADTNLDFRTVAGQHHTDPNMHLSVFTFRVRFVGWSEMLGVPVECDQRSPEQLISGPASCAILSRILTALSKRHTGSLWLKHSLGTSSTYSLRRYKWLGNQFSTYIQLYVSWRSIGAINTVFGYIF
jgi:hypothetical protein